MELLGQLFLAAGIMLVVAVACAIGGPALALGFMYCMARSGLALMKAMDLAERFVGWMHRRMRSVRRLVATVWRFARQVRRSFQSLVRSATRPADRLLDTHPRTQWCARFFGRWTLRVSLLSLLAVPFVLYVGWYVYIDDSDVPDIQVVLDWHPPVIGNIKDRNGAVVMRAAHEFRTLIPTEEFASTRYRVMADALVAAEDKSFRNNRGVDWPATTKAAIKEGFGFGDRGASSITQQVARNLWPELQEMVALQKRDILTVDNFATRLAALVKGKQKVNKYSRKGREIKYAVHIEQKLEEHLGSRTAAKNLIIATYANFVNLGGVRGVEYGAQHNFCKGADQLEPHEAAFLASIIPRPKDYSVIGTKEQQHAAIVRRNHVLRRMYQIDSISWDEYVRYRAMPLGVCEQNKGLKTEAPAAVSFALSAMEAKGYTYENHLLNGDVQLELTLDMRLQRDLNTAVHEGIRGTDSTSFRNRYPKAPLPQVAAVVLRNRDGAVLAMFGGFDSGKLHNYRDNNRAVNARRQPGSTHKITSIFAAASVGFGPESPVSDAPYIWCDQTDMYGNCTSWKSVNNYKKDSLEPKLLQEGSAQSVNTVFARLMHQQVASTPEAQAAAATYTARTGLAVTPGGAFSALWAKRLGIDSYDKKHPVASTVLGSMDVQVIEMANVIRSACTGFRTEPYILDHITDRNGKEICDDKDRDTSGVCVTRRPRIRLPLTNTQLATAQLILRGNIRTPHATGRGVMDSVRFPVEVRGKTGTSNDLRDAWFCSCTDGTDENAVSIAVWVGYDDFGMTLPHAGHISTWAAGGRVALPIAKLFMQKAYGPDSPLGVPPKMPEAGEKFLDEYNAKYHGVATK